MRRVSANTIYITKSSLILIATWVLLATSSMAQPNYEEGVILTRSGEWIHGLIENEDWFENPETIRFKKESSSKAQSFTARDIKEFRISGEIYEAKFVNIDTNPWKGVIQPGNSYRSGRKDTVFLSVLVKAPIKLYYYRDFRDHYYIEDDEGITELIARRYIIEREGKSFIATDEGYREQLQLVSTKCPESNTHAISYSKPSIIRFIVECNKNILSSSVQYVNQPDKISLSSHVSIGVATASFDMRSRDNSIELNPSRNFTYGISTLIIFPRNRERRSIFIDLQFFRFESTNQQPYYHRVENYLCINSQCSGTTTDEYIEDIQVEMNYLKLAFGYRQRFLSGNIRPFLDLGLSISKRVSYRTQGTYDIQFYSYEGNGRPTDDQLILEDSYQGKDEIATPGNFSGGVIGGIGTKIGAARISLRGELNYLSNDFSIGKALSLSVYYNIFTRNP